ncbi:AAA family ATPase [Flavobacterium psychrophilum]|uniref:ATP-dependent nuclease n=1 Tax=Flavobacterium psychrophilum TaxID=96345 RepID=UPI0009044A39|nr:AAA family ATPase [Flavobacterium psychrophilum]MCB6062561.1 AAA family ATPase [Flavobacterium psychrophilum]OJH13424.1 OLD family endonuclease [Flavobacterium psychrophilum]
MSEVRIKTISIENYRSFKDRQVFRFPDNEYLKPISIIGYNNSGKTNLMNSILYSIGNKFTSKETFSINDFYNRDITNIPQIISLTESTTVPKYDGKLANLNGYNRLEIQTDGFEIEGAKIASLKPNYTDTNWEAFGANKYFNIFFINFHNIKEEISTKKTSWGNLTSFLAKHIKKLVDGDLEMSSKKEAFNTETKKATESVLENSDLKKFISNIKLNYTNNLRNNNCHVEFGLPNYEDIFLQMIFKIGLNGNNEKQIPIDQFGDGYISMFVMAVIQAIAETNTEDKCLFLFEEPESFLHENHQEYFYKMVLCPLASKGHQVIYTTHSDKMIDIFDTKSIIRVEFDENEKRTINKYNNLEDFIPTIKPIISLENYNSFIKSVEPNLNKILFSRKVILVEGPNDLLAYNFAIEKTVMSLIKDQNYAKSYLNFRNISIIPHHGKATALLLIDLCKHFGLEYFVINDLDFEDNFITRLDDFENLADLKESNLYLDENSTNRGMITTNWNLIKSANLNNLHFNIPKLESVLGYESNDKNSLGIWNKLNEFENFEENFMPKKLASFLEFDSLEELLTE